jgi:hypothetical protein
MPDSAHDGLPVPVFASGTSQQHLHRPLPTISFCTTNSVSVSVFHVFLLYARAL